MNITKYKTITITTESSEFLIKKMEEKGIYISNWAKDIASKIPTPKKEETIQYGSMTVQELGFTEYTNTKKLFEKIKEKGYELLPAISSLHIRLDDDAQEKGTYYWVAMEPITDSDGGPDVFCVRRDDDGERWLGTGWAYPSVEWDLDDRFAFRLRKETLNSETGKLGALEPLSLELESAIKTGSGIYDIQRNKNMKIAPWNDPSTIWVCEDHPDKEKDHRLFLWFWKRCGGAGMPKKETAE